MNFNLICDNLPLLLLGAGVTIKITAISVGLGFLLGLVVSVCRMSGIKLLNAVCVCYVNIIRGTPILVQIFLIYFALPRVIDHQIRSWRPWRRAPLTAGPMFRKFSAPVSSPWIRAKWKPAVL